MSAADPFVEEFNRILKGLTTSLAVRFPADALVARVKKRVLLAADFDPARVVDAVGPYLYRYRDAIFAGDSRFFLENDYDAEVGRAAAGNADLATHIIPKVKSAWAQSDPAQRAAYTAAVQDLLDNYIEYLAASAAG